MAGPGKSRRPTTRSLRCATPTSRCTRGTSACAPRPLPRGTPPHFHDALLRSCGSAGRWSNKAILTTFIPLRRQKMIETKMKEIPAVEKAQKKVQLTDAFATFTLLADPLPCRTHVGADQGRVQAEAAQGTRVVLRQAGEEGGGQDQGQVQGRLRRFRPARSRLMSARSKVNTSTQKKKKKNDLLSTLFLLLCSSALFLLVEEHADRAPVDLDAREAPP